MNKFTAFLLFLSVLIGITACSAGTPEQQWQKMATVLQDGEQQLKAVGNPQQNPEQVQEILHEISTKLHKVRVKDEELLNFQTSTVNLLTLTAELVARAKSKDGVAVAEIQHKIQAEAGNNLKLTEALQKRFAAPEALEPQPAP